ncbi:outer membrane lipoprotein-sorting protein [Luteolibacter sp. AS25]|uniref:outer membrane lipoprotein-sorting protein n=1 Tax=Luteolibacter sp. AS25 TaxID=3135776 RepID=UPI00398A88B8
MKRLLTLLCGLVALTSSVSAQDPDTIMERARISATLTKLDDGLTGNLTAGRNKVPIQIYLKGENIQFQFSENGKWRIFHMRLSDNKYDLFEIINGKTVNFPRNKLTERIAGTDLTYEDLALRFFYWPNPKLEGEERVGTEECYKIRLSKPAGDAGNYYAVYVWVHKKFGAFMKIEGYGKNGEKLKEFQVEDVMKVADNVWTLRKMQVATYQGGRRQSITDMKLDKPSASALKGLR